MTITEDMHYWKGFYLPAGDGFISSQGIHFDEFMSRYESSRLHQEYRVAFDTVLDWDISTVFLYFDHGYDTDRPILWETMLFDHGTTSETEVFSFFFPAFPSLVRARSRSQAIQNHQEMIDNIWKTLDVEQSR